MCLHNNLIDNINKKIAELNEDCRLFLFGAHVLRSTLLVLV